MISYLGSQLEDSILPFKASKLGTNKKIIVERVNNVRKKRSNNKSKQLLYVAPETARGTSQSRRKGSTALSYISSQHSHQGSHQEVKVVQGDFSDLDMSIEEGKHPSKIYTMRRKKQSIPNMKSNRQTNSKLPEIDKKSILSQNNQRSNEFLIKIKE